jgi:hypothetical protein
MDFVEKMPLKISCKSCKRTTHAPLWHRILVAAALRPATIAIVVGVVTSAAPTLLRAPRLCLDGTRWRRNGHGGERVVDVHLRQRIRVRSMVHLGHGCSHIERVRAVHVRTTHVRAGMVILGLHDLGKALGAKLLVVHEVQGETSSTHASCCTIVAGCGHQCRTIPGSQPHQAVPSPTGMQ